MDAPPLKASESAPATAGEIMHAGVIACAPAATAAEVARLMAEHGVHSVIVLSAHRDDGRTPVWGLVSALDLLAALVDPAQNATAADLAREPVITVRSTRPLVEAAAAMLTYGVEHLIVTDPDGDPAGVLSALDVAGVMTGSPSPA